jgi:hypothetical protein
MVIFPRAFSVGSVVGFKLQALTLGIHRLNILIRLLQVVVFS